MLESLLVSTLAGAVIAVITEFAKRFGVSTRVVLAAVTVGAALAYTAFDFFVPTELKQSVIQFATQSLGTAVVFYEFVYKNFKTKE